MGEHPMYGFGMLIDILKKKPRRIVFTEGNDPRILEAASRLLAGTFLSPILVGDEEEIFEEIVSLLHCYSMKLYSKRRVNKLNKVLTEED